MSDCKLHRLIPVASIAAEVAANWVQTQAIPAAAQASDGTGDPGGLYDRQSAGAQGFEAVAYWEDADRDVVHDAADVGLRPHIVWGVVGSDAERVAYADAALAKPPGTVLPFAALRPSSTWLKVTSATAPGGAAFLAIYSREVP